MKVVKKRITKKEEKIIMKKQLVVVKKLLEVKQHQPKVVQVAVEEVEVAVVHHLSVRVNIIMVLVVILIHKWKVLLLRNNGIKQNKMLVISWPKICTQSMSMVRLYQWTMTLFQKMRMPCLMCKRMIQESMKASVMIVK